MNIARRATLLLDAFLFELCGFGVLDVVGNVGVAIVCARIDVQEFFRRECARKIGVQLEGTREPCAHAQLAADVRKGILERVGIPKADAITILQTLKRFGREHLEIRPQ